MFDMFRGGKTDPVTLMVLNHEQRQLDLRNVVKYIQKNYTYGDEIDLDEVAADLGIESLTDDEVNFVIKNLK